VVNDNSAMITVFDPIECLNTAFETIIVRSDYNKCYSRLIIVNVLYYRAACGYCIEIIITNSMNVLFDV